MTTRKGNDRSTSVVGRDEITTTADPPARLRSGRVLRRWQPGKRKAEGYLLFGAENREGRPLSVAAYLRDECSPFGIEGADNMVARFRNDRACLIFQRGDFVGGSVFEVDCDRHSFVYLEFSLSISSILRALLAISPLKFSRVRQYEPSAH